MPEYAEGIVCFTDIINSSQLSRNLGSEQYSRYRNEHFTLADTLAKHFSGTIKKNTGDGVLTTFSDIKKATAFAANIQFFYQKLDSKIDSPIHIRLGLHKGTHELEDNDVQGGLINESSRIEGKGNGGAVTISSDFLESLERVFAKEVCNQLISDKREVDLRGIDKKTICSLNIMDFFKNDFDSSFFGLGLRCLESYGVHFSNIKPENFYAKNKLILPIVPRDGINLVHCGLIEIVRIVSMFGWGIILIIADFGKDNVKPNATQTFKEKLCTYIQKRGIKTERCEILSDLITHQNQPFCCKTTHEQLYPYMQQVKAGEMIEILQKQYEDDEKLDKNKSYLNSLRPVFTLAAVRQLLNETECDKAFVLSGDDERKMWSKCISLGYQQRLGAIHMPIITKNTGPQFNQNFKDLYWHSVPDILENIQSSNIATWSAQQIFGLQNFPCHSIFNDMTSMPKEEDFSGLATKILEVFREAN